jgi:hypothetical protein
MNAKELLSKRDTDFGGEPQLFFNCTLGIPFEDTKASLPLELLRGRCAPGLMPGFSVGTHVLGADQGAYLLIARCLFPPTPAREYGSWGIVHAEHVEDLHAFSRAEDDEAGNHVLQAGRLTELMQTYDVGVACVDAQPDLSNVRSLQRDCPYRVWAVHSSGVQKVMFQPSDDKERAEWPTATESIHASFDRLFRAVREKELVFHRIAGLGLTPYPEDAELLQVFSHLCNIAKVRRSETKSGRQVQESSIYVPRGPAKTHPVHYATAATKLLHAIKLHLDGQGSALAGVILPSEGMLTFQAKGE